MRKVAAISLVTVFATSSAFGGLVTFGTGMVEIDITAPGPHTATFDVTIESSTIDVFTAVDLIFGSDRLTIPADGFTYSDDTIGAVIASVIGGGAGSTLAPPYGCFGSCVYASEAFVGTFASDGFPNALLFGTLTVDAAGLDIGEYSVMVDSERDGGVSQLIFSFEGVDFFDPLNGIGIVHVVPEPATIALLGLGAIGLLRRRRSA